MGSRQRSSRGEKRFSRTHHRLVKHRNHADKSDPKYTINKTRLLRNQVYAAFMTPKDHNKTLAIIYSLLGGFFTLPLLASPWILAKNVDSYPSPRRNDQIIIATVIFCVVLFLALLFLATAVSLYRRRSLGRKLALVSSVLLLPLLPPIATYTWWFMHSEGGKQMYGVVDG